MDPIIDYHGRVIDDVCVIYKSAGAFVYADIDDDFLRLTPEQARDLASRLNAAADEADPERDAEQGKADLADFVVAYVEAGKKT